MDFNEVAVDKKEKRWEGDGDEGSDLTDGEDGVTAAGEEASATSSRLNLASFRARVGIPVSMIYKKHG